MKDKFSILVNTTDSFSDCWEPFFKLFKEFWPEYRGKIYLNTEEKSFKYKDLDIISIKNGLKNKPWSECLIYAINKIDNEYFIYMQEDYFLHKMVDHVKVENLYKTFVENKLDCLHLTDQCSRGPFYNSDFSNEIWGISNGADYRISTQAAFWRKKMILKVLRPWESGWDFEKFASLRSNKNAYKIMSINHNLFNRKKNEILPYVFTGIIKGKWKKDVVNLFSKNNIEVDFSLRGFSGVTNQRSFLRKLLTLNNLVGAHIKNFYMEKIFRIKFKKNKNMNLVKTKFLLKDYKKFDKDNREVYLLERNNCDYLLEEFYKNVRKVIKNKKHLPIIRIADGEFQFLLGKNEFNLRKPFLFLLQNLIGEIYRNIFSIKFEAKSRTYTSGVYKKSDFIQAKRQYAECLKHVAKNGILAIYTIVKPNFYTEQYLPKLFEFFKKNKIKINLNNYVPFYFIYIILTNPRFSDIYSNMRVHLITSFDEDRKKNIENSLILKGVKSITWTQISKDKSLFDEINLNRIDDNIDIIFVGAGVGKVNIFNQLKKSPCLIIDAGYIFETWQDPNLNSERDYCATHTY